MTINIGINGYGRIGRNILRALYESGRTDEIRIVAVNDLGNAETNAHLTRYDTAHGKFPGTVEVDGDYMLVNGDRIRVLSERTRQSCPGVSWAWMSCMNPPDFSRARQRPARTCKAAQKRSIISAPGGKDVDATIVYGVNHGTLKKTDTVISNASCTTNCLGPGG